MKIGFDLDGTCTKIVEYMQRKGKSFFQQEVVNKSGFTIMELFEKTEQEQQEFWTRYLLEYSLLAPLREGLKENIQKLQNDGHFVYLITARVFGNRDDMLGRLTRLVVKLYFSLHGIHFDEIIFTEDTAIAKKKICDQIGIQMMVEDKRDTIEYLSQFMPVICVDELHNQDCRNENIKHIKDVDEIYPYVADYYLHDSMEKGNIVDGKASVEKPHLRFYSQEAIQSILPEITVYTYLYQNNQYHLDDVALYYFERKITYRELFEMIDECAKSFLIRGVQENDIITICMPNTPEAVVAFYALNKIGAVACMVHPLSSAERIKCILNATKSKYMVMIDQCQEKISSIQAETLLKEVITVAPSNSMPLVLSTLYTINCQLNRKQSKKFKKALFTTRKKKVLKSFTPWSRFIKSGQDYHKEVLPVPFKEGKMTILMCTGGTSGIAKQAMLSDFNFNSMVHDYRVSGEEFERGDSMTTIMPIFHGFGLCNCVHMPLCLGVSVNLVPKFNVNHLKSYLKQRGNGNLHIMGVPKLFEHIIESPKLKRLNLNHLSHLIFGGAPLKNNIEERSNRFLASHGSYCRATQGYGLTECVASATYTLSTHNINGTVGIPLIHTAVKIVEPGTTQELNYNEVGEICISGPTVMLGYYQNEEETRNALQIHNDGKLWLHTGDRGYIRETGDLAYCQRMVRTIFVNGYNVYPNEIEQIIESIPEVAECTVVGTDQNGKTIVTAFIVLHDGMTISDDMIYSVCARYLDAYAIPKQIQVIPKMPTTLLEKLDYRSLEKSLVKTLK